MWRVSVCGLLAALILLPGICPFVGNSDEDRLPRPRIHCATPEISAGDFTPNVRQVFMFELSNTGNAVLVISNVRACCGTTVELSQKVIPPGSNAVVNFTLRASRSGMIKKSFYIHSNDPINPVYQLRVTGRLRDPAEILMNPPSEPGAGS